MSRVTSFLYLVTFATIALTFTEARVGFTRGFSRRELQTGSLELCQGDCDSDSDCIEGLKCFHRQGGDALPLCSVSQGQVDSRTDYCVPIGTPDNLLGPSVHYSGNNGQGPFPLAKCQGDCDNDSDCQTGLTCFQRNAGQPVPGCRGGRFDGSRTGYCIDPADRVDVENTNFPLSSSRDLTMFLNYTIGTAGPPDRQPTDAEYSALLAATDKWMTDQTDKVFASNTRQLSDVALTLTVKDYYPNQPPTHQLRYDVKFTWAVATEQDAVSTADILMAFQSSYDFAAYINPYLLNLPESNPFRWTITIGRGRRWAISPI